MWRNYLTVGVRSLIKNKTYAFINIVGLAIGLAACLILLVYVRYETTYDRSLPNAENTYEFQTYFKNPQTGEEGNLQMTAYVFAFVVVMALFLWLTDKTLEWLFYDLILGWRK